MKTEGIIVEGNVIEPLGGIRFRCKLDSGDEVIATICGKLQKHFIKILPADRVQLEVSPYDLTRGFIKYRYNK